MHNHAGRLSAVVTQGDRRLSLEALRDALAVAIDACGEPKDVAPLARQLQAVLADIEGLPVAEGTDDIVSQFRKARTVGKSGASRSKPASGQRRKSG